MPFITRSGNDLTGKNLRSYLSRIDVIANIGMDGSFYISGATTAHIDVDIFAEETHG